jgi:hypothetical protein
MEPMPEQQALDFPTKPLTIQRPTLLYGEVPKLLRRNSSLVSTSCDIFVNPSLVFTSRDLFVESSLVSTSRGLFVRSLVSTSRDL